MNKARYIRLHIELFHIYVEISRKDKILKTNEDESKFVFALGWKLELRLTADGFEGMFGIVNVF